jgi:PilZ domain
MTQKSEPRRERRLAGRRRPKTWTKAVCRKGSLDLGSKINLGILDLAENGVRLLTSEPLENNQEVSITLGTPTHLRPLRVVGHVVWCVETLDHTFCVGIRFCKRLSYPDVTKLS